jgi:phage anti-repressor protein
VNARDLRRSLEVGKDFSTWIKDRIGAFSFAEHADFVMFEDLSSPELGSAKARPQRTVEYALTLDMAKELAMVERNEAGKRVRYDGPPVAVASRRALTIAACASRSS